ncbi:MAG: YicC family protein [Cyclobacteriaceae bacterium]|nr:YicC family protein [Cyclobacteriaceae bacterium]
MLRSMTGFGQAIGVVGEGSIHVEVKSLNSKFLDLNLKLPAALSEKDMEIRNLIQDRLERGKISATITLDRHLAGAQPARYHEERFIAHYLELKKLADRVVAPYDTLFELALRSPEVSLEEGKASPEILEKLMDTLTAALAHCNKFREDEGRVLAGKLGGYIDQIEQGLNRIESLDTGRVDKIRKRLRDQVTDFFGEEGFDKNRLEQELIFYVEKLDIHEERVRLRAHLSYFRESMKSASGGKKLGFISQEIGREINTIGSKANDAAMQREVVGMKEELEKIKEQLNNVL